MQPDGDVIDMTEPAERLGIENDGLNLWWAASPSGQVAVAADSTIEIWDPATGEFVRSVDKPILRARSSGWDIAFAGTADDGTVVVRCNGLLMAWDLASPDRASQWQVPIANQSYNARVRISPDRSRILVPADKLKLIDAETGDTVAEAFAGSVINDAYSPDGRLILAVDWPGDVQVFDADDLTLHQAAQAQWRRRQRRRRIARPRRQPGQRVRRCLARHHWCRDMEPRVGRLAGGDRWAP